MTPRSRLTALGALAALVAACRPGVKAPSAAQISVPYELDTLDPHAQNLLGNFALLSHVYEPLVTTDATMSIVPCLAERWDNPDLKTWVFHLRGGVRFHDGSLLKASDVASTFRRLLGSRELEMSGYLVDIASVKALSPRTLEIVTKKPLAVLLNKLCFILVAPEGSDTASLTSKPNGTGPFRFASWKRNESIRLERNETYWGAKPALAEVSFLLNRTADQAIDDLLSRRSGMVESESKRLEGALRNEKDVEVLRQSSIFVKYLGFDQKRDVTPFSSAKPNPFKDLRVREAIQLAVDRKALVESLPTAAVPAWQPLPRFIFGFDAGWQEPAFDPARARRLLGEAGLGKGFSTTLHVRRLFAAAASPIRRMLADVGIAVDVVVLSDPDFFRALAEGKISFYLSRFGCPTGDASDILDNHVHSRDPERHFGSHNTVSYSDPELDRRIETSGEILETPVRREALLDIMRTLREEVVFVPLFIDQDVFALRKGLVWRPRNDDFVLAREIGLRAD